MARALPKLPNYAKNEYTVDGKVYSHPTKADSRLLYDLPDWSPDRSVFLADNCEKLADLLEHHIPRKLHDQETWAERVGDDGKPMCGTSACALGWAVMMHIIPGLQHRIETYRDAHRVHHDVIPTINGQESSWPGAGGLFFGDEAFNEVFFNTEAPLSEVVLGLRAEATRLRHQAKDMG